MSHMCEVAVALTVALLAWGSIGSASAAQDTDGSLAKLSAADRDALTEALNAKLFDGEAARVRDFHLNNNRQGCGYVNGKNLHGGYAGYRRFAVDLKNKDLRLPNWSDLLAISDYRPTLTNERFEEADRAICDAVMPKR